jgi:hypothetical protein
LAIVLILLGSYTFHSVQNSRELDHEVNVNAPPDELLHSAVDHLQYVDYRYVRTSTVENSTDCTSATIVRERGWSENTDRQMRRRVTIGDDFSRDIYITPSVLYFRSDFNGSWTLRTAGGYQPEENPFVGGHDVIREAEVTVVSRSEETIALRVTNSSVTEEWFSRGFWEDAEAQRESRTFYLDADTGRIQRVERTLHGGYHGDYCEVITFHDYGTTTADRPDDIGFHIEEVLLEVLHRLGLQ